MSVINLSYKVEGFLKIYDPSNGEIFVDKKMLSTTKTCQ